jgi:superfamily II DNA or RNA helicase
VPKIVLTDNREIHLKSSEIGLRTYSSIRETIKHGHISYPDFLFRDEVIDHTLSEASDKLSAIRHRIPNAGGLVVAATVAHAEHIATRLAALGERSVVVSCRTPYAHQIINDFRVSEDRWIISVGMISEGTDIPRLQVCCHLSRIRTELHFRQVLGRILRRQASEPSETGGWLYVLAESNLMEFASRVDDDLPDENVVSFSPSSARQGSDGSSDRVMPSRTERSQRWGTGVDSEISFGNKSEHYTQGEKREISISQHYWSEVLSLFEGSPRRSSKLRSVMSGVAD